MNAQEATTLLKLASAMYPANQIPEARMPFVASVWADAIPEPLEVAIGAFREAAMLPCHETRMPSLPSVRKTIEARKPFDPENQFRLDHDGMTREQWREMQAEEERRRNSPEFRKRQEELHSQMMALFKKGRDADNAERRG